MPFVPITSGADKGKYRSPSGRIFTLEQVRAYYAKQHDIKNRKGGKKK